MINGMRENVIVNKHENKSVVMSVVAPVNSFYGTALAVSFFAFSRFFTYYYYYFYTFSKAAKSRKCFG